MTPEVAGHQLKLVPTALQEGFIQSPVDETLYGGARGGGKTFSVILDWLIHSEAFGRYARGVVFRRSLVELDDFIESAKDILEAAGHVWNEQRKVFKSPAGAILKCRYLENDDDARKYQGHAYSRIYVEEIGNFPSESPIRKLFGALRPPVAGGPPIRCQFKATANPGGPGQTWVKARYIDPAPAGTPFSMDGGKRYRVFIPAKLTDNPHLMENDPTYIERLKDVGSEELVRAWLDGDWNTVVGQYFREFNILKHVIPTVELPTHWKVRFRAGDWGSARPYCFLWFAVADGGPLPGVKVNIPRGALVVYRELYGWNGKPNEGRRQTAAEVAKEILKVEHDHKLIKDNGGLNKIDPSTFNVVSGPSIAEEMARAGVWFKRADNSRVGGAGPLGGWNQVRTRLKGDGEAPMIYFMDCCVHVLRTLPMIPTDPVKLDDVDTDSEDHAADALRYGCMVRPYLPPEAKNRAADAAERQYARPMSSFTMAEAWQCKPHAASTIITRD